MNKYSKRELCLIWLDSFVGLEYKHKRELIPLIEEFADIPTVLDRAKDYLMLSLGEQVYKTLKTSANKEYLEFILKSYSDKGVSVVTILSDDYPDSLVDISHPPIVIYYKGDIKLLSCELFAIVGSRKSLALSLSIAENYTEQLIKAGFVPVTGIAEGVDGKVLATAYKMNGKAVSVIAGGFDHVYPKNNADLVEKIAKTGLIISEYPPATVPKPFNFPIRNRIIAGLSKGVLVVSGGIKSGTLYTAEYAQEYSKDLFAIPYSVGVLSGAGCNELIKCGAILTDTPKDILDFYGKQVEQVKISLTDDEKKIVHALSDGQLHIEKICLAVNKPVFEITPLLSILEIKGVLTKSGNVYSLIRNNLED